MSATKEQLAWAADKFGYEANSIDVIIIHADGTEELATMLTPDSKKPIAPADDTAKK